MDEITPSESTFESAMLRLEQIVEQMESDKLPLEEMLLRYEEGTKLVRFCSEKLAAAEKRIEMITRNAAGKPQIAEFDPAAVPLNPASPAITKPGKAQPAPPKPASDEISLF